MTINATGSCLCGAVKYRLMGSLRPVVACHCGQCQKTSGHHVAATSVNRKDFELLKSVDSNGFLLRLEFVVGFA